MVRNLCALAALVLISFVVKSSPPGAPTGPFTIPDTEVFEYTSPSLDRTYPIYVYLPPSYNKDAERRFPVVFVNDGPYAFPVAAGALSVPMNAGYLQEFVVVGIGFSKGDNKMLSRIRDYTPSVDENWKDLNPGEAAQYTNFLANELIPLIEENYRVVSDRRTLVGHSAGGLYGSYVLLSQPELFDNYVILSPALFFDNRFIFGQEKKFAEKHKDLNARVYFAVGTAEQPPVMHTDWVKDQEAFVRSLLSRNYPSLTIFDEMIEGGLHETTYPQGFVRGMQWLFRAK
ncbi:MAG: alpha/beta hydrolase [Kordiimonadaceae bacterium]|nr:alpha/beta hydrolase [Kordiimonadaceae bacterium]MBO6568666.1 alpha/beta hydrolase [Kordiimonadaceae bacterium]MBO6965358.1 alpha/beta hydrolase [Kordiimonadaceae bacterium]